MTLWKPGWTYASLLSRRGVWHGATTSLKEHIQAWRGVEESGMGTISWRSTYEHIMLKESGMERRRFLISLFHPISGSSRLACVLVFGDIFFSLLFPRRVSRTFAWLSAALLFNRTRICTANNALSVIGMCTKKWKERNAATMCSESKSIELATISFMLGKKQIDFYLIKLLVPLRKAPADFVRSKTRWPAVEPAFRNSGCRIYVRGTRH